MQAVHTTFTEMVDEHKEYKKEEPLVLTKSTIKDVFKACGASPEHIEAFEEKFDESFGEEAQINLKAIRLNELPYRFFTLYSFFSCFALYFLFEMKLYKAFSMKYPAIPKPIPNIAPAITSVG